MKYSHLVFLAFFCTSVVSADHLLNSGNFSGAWYLVFGPVDGHHITGSQIMDFDPHGEIIEIPQVDAVILESLFLGK